MAVILYLSNNLVQAVDAREKDKVIQIQNVYQEEVEEGCLINGIITDEEAFLIWIKKFFIRNKLPQKDIALVINSSQFTHKVLEFPKVSASELRKMIPREFAENRTENTLFTYDVLELDNAKKSQQIFVTAVEKQFLASYIRFFKQAEIDVISIDSGISALVRLFVSAPEIRNKNCMVQVLDGQEVISMLFARGRYCYSQRNRLFSSEEAKSRAKELETITDKLMQFAATQIKEPIDVLYLCGKGYSELVPEMKGRKIFKGEYVIESSVALHNLGVDFLYPVGCLLCKKNSSSLYKQLRDEQGENKKKRELLTLILPPAVVLGICLIITIGMGQNYLSNMNKLKEIQNLVQDEEMAQAHTSYKLSAASVETMHAKITSVETIWKHLMSYPTMNSSIKDVIASCAAGKVTFSVKSFQRDSGVLAIEASATDVRSINGFITALQEQEIFEEVEYSGYTYVSSMQHYNIHVMVCLAEGAGR